MIAVLAWGWISFHHLPQQEDPTFPTHDALIVTIFPGASALQVEQLVAKPLEQKIAEQDTVEGVEVDAVSADESLEQDAGGVAQQLGDGR